EAIKLSDRMVILNVGGILEQAAPPAEVLAAPSSDFVADFVGDERGLKRLALLNVSDIAFDRGPVVHIGSSGAEAQRIMDDERVDWIGVLDGDRLLGWKLAHQIGSTVDTASLDSFRAVV